MKRDIQKYPRTRHILGSRLQQGDEDLEAVPFESLQGRRLVVEEKCDGANTGISFDGDHMFLQSRGHYLTGGPRERHYNLFKQWAAIHQQDLRSVLEDRYILYAEWMYAKHTCFYDLLPHYVMEFDVLDTETNRFLDTECRSILLHGLPIAPVRVLHTGTVDSLEHLKSFIGQSAFMSENHTERLQELCVELGLDAARHVQETDSSNLMEGLYIKEEPGDGYVGGRFKFVRPGFFQKLEEANDRADHWLDRPIIPNQLKPGVDIFAQ